jgi:outer membrane murein-binding lipoprotein Lpp
MQQGILDLKLFTSVGLAALSGAVATSPLDHAVIQYGALGLLAVSVIWMMKVIIPQFTQKFFDSHDQHVKTLNSHIDRLDDHNKIFSERMIELSAAVREHTQANRDLVDTNREMVKRVSRLMDSCPAADGDRDGR